MIIKDSIEIRAPVQKVWDFLLDIDEMGGCIPGVDSVEAIDSTNYRGHIGVRIGPISAGFNGKVTLSEVIPPERLKAEVNGEDRESASSVKAIFESKLEPIENGTRLDFQIDVQLRGRLARFGSAVVQATAKKMTAEFAKNLREKLEA